MTATFFFPVLPVIWGAAAEALAIAYKLLII
jgi:hypothetical protein